MPLTRDKERRKREQIYEPYYAGRKFFDLLYRDTIRKHLKPGQRVLDALEGES